MSVLKDGRIELDFVPGDRVDERHDELEECVDEEGDVDNECEAEAFGIVGLENV